MFAVGIKIAFYELKLINSEHLHRNKSWTLAAVWTCVLDVFTERQDENKPTDDGWNTVGSKSLRIDASKMKLSKVRPLILGNWLRPLILGNW